MRVLLPIILLTALTPSSLQARPKKRVDNRIIIRKATITHYCRCSLCCRHNTGITTSGKRVHRGVLASRSLPFGTQVYSKGVKLGTIWDRGGKDIDVYVSSHQKALRMGKRRVRVKIVLPRG